MFAKTLVAAAAAAGAAQAAPAPPPAPVANLERAQNADGGFGAAAGAPSAALFSDWAAIGLAAADRDAGALHRPGGATLGSAVDADAATATGVGDAERALLALAATGRPTPPALVARVVASRRPDGSIGGLANLTAFGVLALRAAGQPTGAPAVRGATRWLARQQNRDGGFSYARRGTASGVDDTGAALEALVAGGTPRRDPDVRHAVRFLELRQRPDGGFTTGLASTSNAQSTAFAVQGLVAAGVDPSRLHRRRARSPLAYLRSLIGPDGAVRYSRTGAQTPVWVTAQALAALAERPLPIRPG